MQAIEEVKEQGDNDQSRRAVGKRGKHPSDVLDENAADLVGDILEAVDDFLQLSVDLASDHVGHRVAAGAMT